MSQCEYCNKEFKSNSNLNYHKKNAIYCLKLQNKDNKDISFDNFSCPDCGIALNQASFKIHKQRCVMKKDLVVGKIKELQDRLSEITKEMALKYEVELSDKDDIIAELLKKVTMLEKQTLVKESEANIYEKIATKTHNELVEIAKQPKTNTVHNNLNINTPLSFNASDIHNGILSKFTGKTLIGGAKDLAALTIEYLTDDDGNLMYKCTDHSRGNFDYLDERGNMVKDVGAIKLLESMFKAGLKSIVRKQGVELNESNGLPMVQVQGYQEQFSQDGEKGKRFSGAFRKHLANKTCICEL